LPKICLGQDGFVKLGSMIHPRREEILAFAQREGFEGIELHALWEIYVPGSEGTLRRYYSKFDQEIPGLQTGHITGIYSPISEDEDIRKRYVAAVADAIKFIAGLGGEHVSITPPYFMPGQTQETYTANVKKFTEVVHEAVAVAEKHGPLLAVEPEPNLILNGGNFRDAIDDVKELLATIDSKHLNVLFDFPHVNVLSHHDPVGFLKQLNGRVSWAHVADNDMTLTMIGTGKHLEFGKGNMDIVGLVKALKEARPRLPWLQIDTWESTEPFEQAASNRRQLSEILKTVGWT
jgi:sugar phosphate isomerase/epimerase